MSKEKINFDDYTLDPDKLVEVPIGIWSTLYRVIAEVSKKENKSIREYVYAYYHKDTKKKLSNSGKNKISKEKLDKDYYRDIDLEASKANVKTHTSADGLGIVSLELLAAFDAVFKENVEKGNKVLRNKPTPENPLQIVTDKEDES